MDRRLIRLLVGALLSWLGATATSVQAAGEVDSTALASAVVVAADAPELAVTARQVAVGGSLRIEQAAVDGFADRQTLNLSRFQVFADGAQVVIDGVPQAAPLNAYFRGTMAGFPDARVLLTVPEQGPPRGLIFAEGKVVVVQGQAAEIGAGGLKTRQVDVAQELTPLAQRFRCGLEEAGPEMLLPALSRSPTPAEKGEGVVAPQATSISRVAHLYLETDYEYYTRFNNTSAASNYAADLIAYSSSIYEDEVTTGLMIDTLTLYTSNSDPWTVTTNTADALYELRNYFNAHYSAVNRTTVHLLSGKSLGGGIAYVGVLCNKSYGYGLTANINGGFDIDNPGVGWDIIAVSHELGHNFGSSHSHCYAGVGGVASDVDHCYGSEGGCYSGAVSLPGTNSTSGGSAGTGAGTLMSYCHLLSGGYNNISLTFGLNHTSGVAAYRVPAVMSAHVANQASSYTSCFTTNYRVGVTVSGGGVVTSAPAGIHCGTDATDCIHAFNPTLQGSVTLTATPDSDQSFLGWGGACSGSGSCVLSMNSDKSVTATFDAVTCTGTDLVITNETFSSDTDCTATHSLTTSGTVTVEPGVTVNFQAPTITLQPTFKAQPGSAFRAAPN